MKVNKLINRPDFSFERRVWRRGIKYIGGLDEVGRGSFAGPVVAGCVVFDQRTSIPEDVKIHDSKKLTPKQRKEANLWIRQNALYCSVGKAHVGVINKKGIRKASHIAFRKAVTSANEMAQGRIEYLLIDAFFVPYLRGFPSSKKVRQEAIKKGDTQSLSIAAASIVAKEYRDSLMRKLSRKNPFKKYLWYKNMGYGTKEHGDAIKRHGITKYHRIQFVETYLSRF